MKTAYERHDARYQEKKERGQAGWDDATTSAEVIAQFTMLLQHECVPRSGRLLELGCGAGNLSMGFAQLGYHVTGVDISETAISWARQRFADAQYEADFTTADILSYTPDARAFHMVIDSHCLHCIIGYDRARFFKLVHEALHPDGVFVVNTMCRNEQSTQLPGFELDTGIVWVGDIATRWIGTDAQILDELTLAGFEIVTHRKEVDGEPADDFLAIAVPSDT